MIPPPNTKKEPIKMIDVAFKGNLLTKKVTSYLIPMAPRVPIIYYLPKVHKDPVNPPVTPVISGLDSVTSRIRKYIDGFLQSLVSQTQSFLKDSS